MAFWKQSNLYCFDISGNKKEDQAQPGCIVRYSFLYIPKSMGMILSLPYKTDDLASRTGKMQFTVAHGARGLHGKPQTEGRREGGMRGRRSMSILLITTSLNHSVCCGHFIADQAVMVKASVAEANPKLKNFTDSIPSKHFPCQKNVFRPSSFQMTTISVVV